MRNNMKASGVQSPTYNSTFRASMKNSLTLPIEETKKRIASGDKYVVKLKCQEMKKLNLKIKCVDG